MSKLSNIKILLVDDDDNLRETLKEHLIESGGLVAEASDGKNAFSQIKKYDFDVIVSDLRERNTSGIELMELIRHYQGKAPRVIFMSSFEDISSAEKNEKSGDGLYLKPQNIKDLIDLIKEDS
jgi:ATP-dependent Lon protease